MGITEMEEVIITVKSILKTLECPICLELLNIPVSAGCGHFFCRQCASGILQSTYRAPCPLCKRSFTRRSIQEAAQRQSVIAAAKILASTCTSLTGIKFMAQENVKETNETDVDVSKPLKKFKSSKQENQDTSSRKRKSFENEEDVKTAVQENTLDLKTKGNEVNGNLPTEECLSPNKRACPDSEDDSDDLPPLEDLLKQIGTKNSDISVINETVADNPLSIRPTDKASEVKTYLSAHRKAHQQNIPQSDSSNSSVALSKLKTADVLKVDEIRKCVVSEKTNKNESSLQNAAYDTQMTNEINALKNKTNEVQPDCGIIQNGDSSSKTKVLKGNKVSKSGTENKSKENDLNQKCLSRKLRCKKKNQNKPLYTNTDTASNLLVNDIKENLEVTSEKCQIAKESGNKECYTLNQVTLLHSQNTSENGECAEKPADDPFRAIGLTDTNVSVDSVTSPLAAKNSSVNKSPGWSRVKKGKRDFKMKKFTSLHVEKNSPSASLKNVAVTDQETSNIDNSDHSVDGKSKTEDKLLESTHEYAADVDVLLPHMETHKENKRISLSEVETPLFNKEMSKSNVTCEHDLNNTDKSYLGGEMCEEMDFSVSNPALCAKEVAELRIGPSVSITSNSLLCTKYSDVNNKNSSQNVLNAQKIICEVQNTTSLNNNLFNNQKRNIVSEYGVQEDFTRCTRDKNMSFGSTSEIKKNVIALPTHISKYQGFHAQSFQNDDNFQYVEQSQQTSQVLNINFQNPVCDNLQVMIPSHQPPQFLYPNKEKTKVVKRTCLTLEEIQDCFIKSSQTGCSETLCSVPFLSGLFKLHIGVADETLNVSVLKVIDPASESNVAPNAISLLSDKCVQASNSLFPPVEVVPSSNAGSESPKSECVIDPFPYLSNPSSNQKMSSCIDPVSPIETAFSVAESTSKEVDLPNGTTLLTPVGNNDAVKIPESKCKYEDSHVNEEDLDISDVIHFPPKITVEDVLLEKDSSPLKHLPQTEDIEYPHSEKCSEQDLPANKEDCDSSLSHKNISKMEQIENDDFSDSDEESLKKLQECVHKERSLSEKKPSRLSLKKKSSFRRVEIHESSDESEPEACVSDKEVTKMDENKSMSAGLPKLPSATDASSSLKESNRREILKKGLHNSVLVDMPSTLNSILSEDASEANASEIILEIEDLSDKIKSLEEKLKLCGHGEEKANESTAAKSSLNESDSEDSTDLFPQSVPPTPPNCI